MSREGKPLLSRKPTNNRKGEHCFLHLLCKEQIGKSGNGTSILQVRGRKVVSCRNACILNGKKAKELLPDFWWWWCFLSVKYEL